MTHSPAPVPARPESVDLPAGLVETHISVLVFIADRAYKLKKPVSFGFLDFSTREAREHFCHREVELNRRLAPDVYLGVADVLGPDGEPADHLVVMRRMPSERRLATLVTGRDPGVPDHLRELARLLAVFHTGASAGPAVAEASTRDAVRAGWDANLAEVAAFVADDDDDLVDPADTVLTSHEVAPIAVLAHAYLDGRGALFERRIADGHCRDGHGDLQAADVFCLDDGPRVLDTIEFDDRLRYGDVINDVAFLAMDLERLGDEPAADRFLRDYHEFSNDTAPMSLRHFYVASRALIRVKVACLRWAQEPVDSAEARASVDEARRLVAMCRSHLERALVHVILVGGSPGTGKTTLARAIGDSLDLPVLRSDEVRKELAGLAPGTSSGAGLGLGLYSAEMTDRTYAELVARARALVTEGQSVVLDASWGARRHRAMVRDLAVATRTELVEFRCAAPLDVAAERVAERMAAGADASDATPAVAQALAESFDPWPDAIVVDTDHPIPAAGHVALEALAGIDAIGALEALGQV